MKLDDKNIDQLFRDAAQNESAPQYHASYWNDVSAAIAQERREKRKLVLWSIGGTFTLFLLALFTLTGLDIDQVDPKYSQSSSSAISPIEYKLMRSVEFSSLDIASRALNEQQSSNESKYEQNAAVKKALTTTPEIVASISNEHDPAIDEIKSPEDSNPSENIASSQFSDHSDYDTGVKLPVKGLTFELDPVGKLPLISERNRFRLTAALNAGLMENYRTSRPFESGIMNISLKGSWIRSNVMISTGIGVQATSNADIVISKRAKYYGFGVVNYQTDLSYQNMYDLFVPIEIGYQHKKTRFGMGLQASYLVNTTMDLSTYEDNNLISQETITGFSNGLNKFSSQGYLWLTQDISPRFSLGMRIGTSFSNRIKEGDYFNESATTNPVFGQFTLQYHIFN